MEEKQVQEFVHRVFEDTTLRAELDQNADGVLIKEGFSPRVAQVIKRLVPHLLADEGAQTDSWWA